MLTLSLSVRFRRGERDVRILEALPLCRTGTFKNRKEGYIGIRNNIVEKPRTSSWGRKEGLEMWEQHKAGAY